MNRFYIYILTILTPTIIIAQLTVVNPGLEGMPGQGITPDPWQNCMPFGFYVAGYGEYATPDTQPNTPPVYEIVLPPSEGDSYIGFGQIIPYNGIAGLTEFQEGFSQELSSPMIANNCPYIFTIDLANGLTPDPWNDVLYGIQTTIGEVKVFGGFDVCSEAELLWESGPITNSEWATYTVEFIPSDNYTHILFACFKAEKDAACGYVLADNITPIINTPPTSNAGFNQEVCENETYLNANTPNENELGTWTVISGNGELLDANNPNTFVSNLSIGDNTFQWTVEADCSDQISTSEVTINLTALSYPNAGQNQQLCENETYLNANNPNEDEIGIWTIISGDANIANINNPNTLVTNLSEGENIFSWSLYSILCDTLTDLVTIDYIISNPYSNAGENMKVCDEQTELNANNPSSNESGIWSVMSGSGIFENPTDPNTLVSDLSIGENTFEWTVSDACESTSSQINITFEAMEVLVNESDYNEYNISCNGMNDGFIELSTIGGYPPYNYNWTGPDNFNSTNYIINNLVAGTYNCMITDSLECPKIISIIVNEPPPLEIELINVDNLDCYDNAGVALDVSGGIGTLEGTINTSWGENSDFTWNNPGQWYLEENNFNQWEGLINLTVVDENGCSTSLNNILVESWNDPIANFSTSTYETGLLETIELFDLSSQDAQIISWQWDFGDGNMMNEQNPIHFYDNPGQYNICLIIEDENGCQSEKCKLINIYNNVYVYIPTGFTINDDNINETFLPSVNGIVKESYEMLIYDRWGGVVFSTNNYQEGWDGTYNGKVLESGIYSYKISYLTPNSKQEEHKGRITLIK